MRNLALFFIILFSAIIIFYDPPVGYQEIKELDSLAAKNPEVYAVWVDFLKINPSPTSSEISNIRSVIKEVAVVKVTSAIVGNPVRSEKLTAFLEAKNQQEHADQQTKELNERLDKVSFKELSLVDKVFFLVLKKTYCLVLLLLPLFFSMAHKAFKPY